MIWTVCAVYLLGIVGGATTFASAKVKIGIFSFNNKAAGRFVLFLGILDFYFKRQLNSNRPPRVK